MGALKHMLLGEWRLQAHPFPHAGVSLSPRADPGQLAYYLDFYEWHSAGLLNGLGPGGSIDVSALRSSETVTILISGAKGSGRSSVKNLLLYELEKASQNPDSGGALRPAPIILDVKVPLSSDQKQAAIMLSFLLADEAERRNPAAGQQITKTFTRWSNFPDAAPTMLFQLLQMDIQAAFPHTEVIVVLDASSHTLTRDTARATNAMLSGFAAYVIMSLTRPDDARFMRDELTGKRRAAWVNAPKVDAAVVKAYVTDRIAAQRAPGFAAPDQIFPFSAGAIEKLFKATAGPGMEPLSIGIVLEKLAGVMARKAQKPGAPPSIITDADMEDFLA